jgi:hypothetical protein
MYQLYLILKSRRTPPTEDELKIAQGKKVLDPDTAAAYLTQLEQASANLVDAFNKQVNKAFGDWNQDKFEDLLAKWLIACDQPFDEVEKPEFNTFIEYTHQGLLHIPGQMAIKHCIMKMGDETIQGIKDMVQVG